MSSYYRVYRTIEHRRELVFATQAFDDAVSFVKANGKRKSRDYEIVRVTWSDKTDLEQPMPEAIG